MKNLVILWAILLLYVCGVLISKSVHSFFVFRELSSHARELNA